MLKVATEVSQYLPEVDAPLSPDLSICLAMDHELFLAVDSGNIDAVKALLQIHAVNSRRQPFHNDAGRRLGLTSLHLAMRRGNAPMTNLLVQAKADINAQDEFGKTPGMVSLEFGHSSLLRAFDHLGDVGLTDCWGQSILHYASLARADDIVAKLLDMSEYPSLDIKAKGTDLLDAYTTSAKHGNGDAIANMLSSNHRASILEHQRSQKLKGPSPALREVCKHGQVETIERSGFLAAHADELNEPDGEGFTALMIALVHGHAKAAEALLERGASASFEVSDPAQCVLMLALRNLAEPKPIVSLLIRKGVRTMLPDLQARMPLSSIQKKIREHNHPIGYLLHKARSDPDKYALLRMLLAAAFIEQPAAALCVAVCIGTSMLRHAEEVRLNDLDLSLELEGASQEVGTAGERRARQWSSPDSARGSSSPHSLACAPRPPFAVGALVSSLSHLDQERLLRSEGGINFLLLAADSQRRKMLSAAPVQQHLVSRWWGDLARALLHGEGVFQWGGPAHIAPQARLMLAIITLLVVIPLNLVLLPLVALYPPLKGQVRRLLARQGVPGVDPRVAGAERMALGYAETEDGGSDSGYSPTLVIWWHDLLLMDVPFAKFFLAQTMSALLLVGLVAYAPCFDFNGHEDCWGHPPGAHYQMVGENDWFSSVFGDVSKSAHPLRMLAAKARLQSTSSFDEDEQIGSSASGETPTLHAFTLFGLPKDADYTVLIVSFLSLLVNALKAKPSFASAYSLASIIASALALAFFFMDLAQLAYLDERYDLQPLLLSLAAFLLCLDMSRAAMLQAFLTGPFVLMILHMITDLVVWLIFSMAFVFAFAMAFYLNIVIRGEEAIVHDNCSLVGTGLWSYVYYLTEIILGLDNRIDCFKELGDFASVTLLQLYLLFALILLLNVLIAMMAKTFDSVRDEQELNYNYIFARLVLGAEFQLGEVPPIFNVLRTPAASIKSVISFFCLAPEYTEMRNLQQYQHASPEELLSQVTSSDEDTDVIDLPKMVSALRSDMRSDLRRLQEDMELLKRRASGSAPPESHRSSPASHRSLRIKLKDRFKLGFATMDSEEVESVSSEASNVTIHPGFDEEVCRLVFPYADKFSHLKKRPTLLTYNSFGEMINEPKQLPTRHEHAAEMEVRALIAFPTPETLEYEVGQSLLDQTNDTFVYHRANDTYGLSHIWTTKYNQAFTSKFVCTTHNPDPFRFKPQAVYEFKRTICKLFGSDAIDRVPIVFARHVINKSGAEEEDLDSDSKVDSNTLPVYVGESEALEKFLRARPDVVDQLKIAKLYPGGFIAVVTNPKETTLKHFDFSAGKEYALYTKVGYDRMACIKLLSIFQRECYLRPALPTETSDSYSA